jgi:NAD(P)-dependent dehydrogenase (short-subunit alcohol dehydrogenase family)
MEFQGATCVITGAARGLGAALARELHGRGAKLMLSDIDGADLVELAKELEAEQQHCNVTDREQVIGLGRAAMDAFGHIDVWINNAGIWMAYKNAEDIDWNEAHRLMEVNYFGLAYGSIEAGTHMRPLGTGTICNVISVRALKGKAQGAAYSASKFAAEGFTQAYRDELKDSGVKIVGVYPYRIKTELFGEHKHEDYEQSMEPAEVAKVIVGNLAAEEPAEHVEIWKSDDVRIERTV